MYVDGNLDGAPALGSAPVYQAINYVQIGNRGVDQNLFFNGALDDLALFSRALTDADVKTLYGGSTQ
jgi:hypothetical protein